MTGMTSHHSASAGTVVWFTPPAIIEALGGAESFDLDVCSDARRPFPTARRHFTVEENGLALDWDGRVWCNPPYTTAIIARFMERMARHDNGMALIFARTETDTFFEHVWGAASAVMFLRGRLHFHVAEDTWFNARGRQPIFVPAGQAAPHNSGAPSVLVAYGADDRDILAAAPIDGQFIPLRLPRSYLVAGLGPSWREAVSGWLAMQPGPVGLDDLYRAFANHPKARGNRNWRAKLRQTLQRGAGERVEKGVWRRRAAA
ncbi:DNA N-6-adenine-methyltransferase [Paradevosia shaoguanensis]|uniref:Phage N-6-adenine-methyltransferase n=1 Tax=Paradevosia shaoguanensis TaxID=1335043 RepID=A0AA41QQW4_9HYPH|nr:DNA N-6-adenine-methyltransferase [Paradevosia shaoguanensis]MCF1744204.1 phage N-6-adenine-methyltransferase [Paradevosia shaoguanensis]MCI0128687.1 phage N-6-adenine-methyltransferase [Paradevosia shaoguanensis]